MLEDTLAFRLFCVLIVTCLYLGMGWLVACGLYWDWFLPDMNARSLFFGALALFLAVCTAWTQG